MGHKQVRPPSSKCKCATKLLKHALQAAQAGEGSKRVRYGYVRGPTLRHATDYQKAFDFGKLIDGQSKGEEEEGEEVRDERVGYWGNSYVQSAGAQVHLCLSVCVWLYVCRSHF